MKGRIPITREGLENLKKELENLKKKERPKIIKEIEIARSYGDLSENAEYEAAKEKQGLIEARIRELEYKIANAYVVEPKKGEGEDKIIFGATVTLKNLDTDKMVTYTLVGPDESDVAKRRISINSPVGKSLLGKKRGEIVEVRTPGGEVEYEIVEVKYE